MQSLILSVLLMGMVPVLGNTPMDIVSSPSISIAPPSPLLSSTVTSSFEGRLSASGMVIVDLASGQKVSGRYATTQLPIASLTKLMTALIIVEHHELSELVRIPVDIEEVEGTVAHLPPSEYFTVGDLLSALLIGSGNDAAETLARFHSGSEKSFVDEMNERAKSLGLRQTSFANPSGLDAPNQWSTSQDLAWLASFVLRKPAIEKRLAQKGAIIESTAGSVINLYHTHTLLHTDQTIVAGKTGTTDAARECLLSIVERGGRRYLIVLLHSDDRYRDLEQILSEFDRLASEDTSA